MSPTMKNALKSMGILAAIALVAVLLLAIANSLFPKYTASLDTATVKILNEMAPTGVSDEVAETDKYFTMAMDSDQVDEWNGNIKSWWDKKNGDASKAGTVLAVYKATDKNVNSGMVFVETQIAGRDADVVLITAIKTDGTIYKVYARQINDSWYTASDINGVNDSLAGKSTVTLDMIKPNIHNSGATVTSTAFRNSILLALKISGEVPANG